jgi:hypothetical protein
MNTILYLIALVLIIAWVIGYVGYDTGGVIHLLLILAVLAIIIKFFRKEKFFRKSRNWK